MKKDKLPKKFLKLIKSSVLLFYHSVIMILIFYHLVFMMLFYHSIFMMLLFCYLSVFMILLFYLLHLSYFLYPTPTPPPQLLPRAWDITQELTEEEERRDVHEQPILMFIKSIVYISLFIIILASFVFQKVIISLSLGNRLLI